MGYANLRFKEKAQAGEGVSFEMVWRHQQRTDQVWGLSPEALSHLETRGCYFPLWLFHLWLGCTGCGWECESAPPPWKAIWCRQVPSTGKPKSYTCIYGKGCAAQISAPFTWCFCSSHALRSWANSKSEGRAMGSRGQRKLGIKRTTYNLTVLPNTYRTDKTPWILLLYYFLTENVDNQSSLCLFLL